VLFYVQFIHEVNSFLIPVINYYPENEDLPALRSFGPMGIRIDWASRMTESFSSFMVSLASGMGDYPEKRSGTFSGAL
jgi:hypothetical protein